MRIAVDENVNPKIVIHMIRDGHSVFMPKVGEPDASWIPRALKLKYELFISNDKEVLDYCNYRKKLHYKWETNIKYITQWETIKRYITLLKSIK